MPCNNHSNLSFSNEQHAESNRLQVAASSWNKELTRARYRIEEEKNKIERKSTWKSCHFKTKTEERKNHIRLAMKGIGKKSQTNESKKMEL